MYKGTLSGVLFALIVKKIPLSQFDGRNGQKVFAGDQFVSELKDTE